MDDKGKKFGYTVGQFVGTVLVGCVGICLSGLAVGLTIKFLMLIF